MMVNADYPQDRGSKLYGWSFSAPSALSDPDDHGGGDREDHGWLKDGPFQSLG